MKKLLIIGACLSLTACAVNKDVVQTTLEASGYQDIKLGWVALLPECGDDKFTRTFTAKTTQGRNVKGVVCKGWFKGAKILVTSVR